MPHSQPIEADNIQLVPGETPQLMNYEVSRYQPFCGNEGCVKDVHFDQIPPTNQRCKHGRGYFLDKDYEAAKRITAENPTGAPRLLPTSSTTPDAIIDFTLGWHEQRSPFAESSPDPNLGEVDESPDPSDSSRSVEELAPSLEDIFGP